MEEQQNFWEQDYKRGRIISGIILILVGCLFFAKKMGVEFPEWIFTWPMFLVALGLYIGGKHNFRNPGWIVIVGFGLLFLVERINPEFRIHDFWPILLIIMGAYLIIRPFRRKSHWGRVHNKFNKNFNEMNCVDEIETNENTIEVTAIMGGVKRTVLSKDFKGGNIECVMGGADINLTQADINGRITLEVNNIFGGTKLRIPSNWEVVVEVMVVLGGVEDKRSHATDLKTTDKTLVIKGSCIFGGVEIKSY